MNTTIAAPSSTKLGVTSIIVHQVEGFTKDLIKRTHATWVAAERHIRSICEKSPLDGGSHKTDFTITWSDGETYDGRYDATNPAAPGFEGTLAQHCLDSLTFSAGLRCPDWMKPADYEAQMSRNSDRVKEATAFLKKYRFDDAVVITPAMLDAAHAEVDGPVVPAGSSAGESAALHRAYCASRNIKLVPVIGNSFPVKGVLYAWGAKWDGAGKCWLVPEYKHTEAQAMVDGYTKAPAPAVVVAAKPAPVVAPPTPRPAPVVTKPAPTPTKQPAKKGHRTPIQKRLDALITGMELLAKDLPAGALDVALASVKEWSV